MTRRGIGVVLSSLFLAAQAAFGGEWLPLSQKLFESERIVEIELRFEKPIPANWPNKEYDPQGWAFPWSLVEAASRAAKLGRVLKNTVPDEPVVLPEELPVFSASSPCWWTAQRHGTLRSLLFLRRDSSGAWHPLFGVEHERGMYTELNPHYEELLTAIREAAGWREERMRAVAPQMLWQRQRQVLRQSDNPYLVHLAVEFLREHEGAGVIDREWGLPGTEARKAAEKRAELPPLEGICGS